MFNSKLLKSLLKDKDFTVKLELAKNPNLPEYAYEALADSGYEKMILTLLRNKRVHSSLPLLKKIYDSSCTIKIRARVAQLTTLPNAMFYHIAKHGKNDVSWYSRAKNSIFHLAKNSSIPPALLLMLAKSGASYSACLGAAKNVKASPKILELLSTYDRINVVIAVAKNKNTPLDVLERLSKHTRWDVRRSVVFNKSVSINILKKMAKRTKMFPDTAHLAKQRLEIIDEIKNNPR